MNKVVIKYINQLSLVGAIYLSIGVALVIVTIVFRIINNSIGYLLYVSIGMLLGYLLITKGDPGGSVNFYFNARKRTSDEQTLYDLVIRHRSLPLINAVFLVTFLMFVLPVFLSKSVNTSINVKDGIPSTIWIFSIAMTIGNGIKYLSAWRKIMRHVVR